MYPTALPNPAAPDAIVRNKRSRSVGTAGRNHPEQVVTIVGMRK
jgi:hypothetical protein